MSQIPILVDLGSSEIKTGFSGQEKPKLLSPNYIGELKSKKNYKDSQKKKYTSDECDKFMGNLILHHPIEKGVFTDPEDISLVFNYIYSKLEINEEQIKEHPILISEALNNPRFNREKISEILFEKVGTPALIFGSQPLLSLFSTGATTGVVLESGDAITQSCVGYEGFLIRSSCFRYDYGGRDVTNVLRALIDKNNYNINFNSFTDMKILKNIKEKQCYLKLIKEKNSANIGDDDNDEEDNKYNDDFHPVDDDKNGEFSSIKSEFILPDGNKIELGDEKILAPEILFNNKLNFSEYPTFHEIIFNTIAKVDITIKDKLYRHIILSGGNTLFKGMKRKMGFNLEKLVPKDTEIKLIMNKNPILGCWNGENVISNMSSFKRLLVSKNDWNEIGKRIVHDKSI